MSPVQLQVKGGIPSACAVTHWLSARCVPWSAGLPDCQVGDSVAPGDVLCEVETDKATISWEAQEEGFVAAILVPGGSKDVPIGTPAAVLVEDADQVAAFAGFTAADAAGGAAAAPKPAASAPPPPPPKAAAPSTPKAAAPARPAAAAAAPGEACLLLVCVGVDMLSASCARPTQVPAPSDASSPAAAAAAMCCMLCVSCNRLARRGQPLCQAPGGRGRRVAGRRGRQWPRRPHHSS